MDKGFMEAWNTEALTALVQTTVYFCEYWAIKNFYDLATGKTPLFAEQGRTIPNLNERHSSTANLMVMMFQNQALYILNQHTNSFQKNMRSQDHIDFFNYKHLIHFSRQYKKTLEILAMSLPDITDGYDFEDE